jgi:Flp pilus assembly protein TadG
MTRLRSVVANERGFALAYTAVLLTGMLLFTGLAVDSGRAYMVKAQLSKAVDGAALGAARNLNSGNPRQEAVQIFRANFPDGYMGTTSLTDPTSDPDFFNLVTDPATGINTVTVQARAVLPTTFMKLANFNDVTVTSSGEATRRMVDLSLILDVSGSIGWRWNAVRDAARGFVDAFDEDSDRLSLTLFSTGADVETPMPLSRGFNKQGLKADIPENLPGGSTSMAEGLYRGWDQLRRVQSGQQSGLRVIVLFTDGATNSVPGVFNSGGPTALRTSDFPKDYPDPDNMTSNFPSIGGLYNIRTGNTAAGPYARTVGYDTTTTLSQVPWMPAGTVNTHPNRSSAGIPSSFPLVSNTLRVNGQPQSVRRPLRNWNATAQRYPADAHNINNAARNLLEIIGNAARSDDDGDYPIRIYTIGMGELVQYELGTLRETSASMLMRIANDQQSPDFNPQQLEGRFYFAQSEADVAPAFQQLQNQIIRLTK